MCIDLRERERERERETLTSIGCPPTHHIDPDGDQPHNLGMCPDWESNLQSFGVWDDSPTNQTTPARA